MPPTSDSRERILDAATELFSSRGYEATSTRTIADSVGLNIATVAYHVGAKSDLYREVLRRVHLAQRDLVTTAAEQLATCEPNPRATRLAMHRFADDYLNFCVAHPEVPALWMRRWLSEGAEMSDIEHELAGPLIAEVAASVRTVLDRAGLAPDLDVEMLVFTIVWTCHSFTRAGTIDDSGARLRAEDLVMLDRFRTHLHRLIDGLILPGAEL